MRARVAKLKSNATKRNRDSSPARAADKLYSIRDIIDEKVERGKLYYRIDWADDSETGEKYSPTWELAEYATEAAVAEWERKNRHRRSTTNPEEGKKKRKRTTLPGGNRGSSKRSKKSAADDDPPRRGSADGGACLFVRTIPEHDGELVVEIPARYDLNRSEYVLVSPSTPQEEAAVQPAAGTCGTRPIVIPDSQGLTELSSSTGEPSQTADSLPSQTVPAKSPEPDCSEHSGQPSQSGPEIPSHQPDEGPTPPSGDGELAISEAQTPGAAYSGLGLLAPALEVPTSSLGFLTQPDFDLPLQQEFLEAIDDHNIDSAESTPAHRRSREGSPVSHSQEAQVVLLESEFDRIRSKSQGNTASELIPDSAQKDLSGEVAPSESHEAAENAPFSNGILSPAKRAGRALWAPREPGQTGSPLRRLSTPSDMNMETSPVQTPRSALEELREKKAAYFHQSTARMPSPGNPVDIVQPLASQVDETPVSPAIDEPTVTAEHPGIGVGLRIPSDEAMSPSSFLVQEKHDLGFPQIPATVAPSDLITSTDISVIDNVLLPMHSYHALEEPGRPGLVPSLQDTSDDDRQQREFAITLPMAASSRDRYLRLIAEEKATMVSFSEVFATSLSGVPDKVLVAKMDGIFRKLVDICDLPPYADDVPSLSPEEMTRHATNTNSKFLFTFELLTSLRDVSMRILIVSRPDTAFNYLEALIRTGNWSSAVLGQDETTEQPSQALEVILARADQNLADIRGHVDVVVLFDDSARTVALPPSLAYDELAPIVLSLVTTYSVEHINSQLDPKLSGLERKNALNLAVAAAKNYLKPSFRSIEGDSPEPHIAAEMFSNFLKNPEIGLNWEPQPLPEEVFDLWLSSQPELQAQAQRDVDIDPLQQFVSSDEQHRRKRPSDDLEERTPKRMRILDLRQATRPPVAVRMSDLLQKTLASHSRDGPPVDAVEVPVEQLEHMAAKIAELEDRNAKQTSIEKKLQELVKGMESRLRSHEKSAKMIADKYKEAIGDRGRYEDNYERSKKETLAAQRLLEKSKSDIEALGERVKALESQLNESKVAFQDSVSPDTERVAQAEKDLEVARAKIQDLEKKVATTDAELGYIRQAYQDASNAHGVLARENQDLKDLVDRLQRQASDNLVKINEINSRIQADAMRFMADEFSGQIRDRDQLIIALRDELQHIKHGRQTRQASVPRSPRLNMMSPRPNRGIGNRAGTGSRGTSPAPAQDSLGATPIPGMSSGRWPHLR